MPPDSMPFSIRPKLTYRPCIKSSKLELKMTEINPKLTANSSTKWPLGFLLDPFGWAAPKVVDMLRQQPEYFPDLLHVSQARMHLLGIALAHVQNASSPDMVQLLFRGKANAILDTTLGHRPRGLKRAVRHMPHIMLTEESYRGLVELLADPLAVRFISHWLEIRNFTIRSVKAVPLALRALIFPMLQTMEDMSSFPDALKSIASRSGKFSFDELVAYLASTKQPVQFVAKLTSIVESLPIPEGLPPSNVLHAKRIDSAKELRSLGRKWKNCLGSYVWSVEQGQSAIYLWQCAEIEAICSVTRKGRLGWFLEDIKGPSNARVWAPHRGTILNAFANAGLPPETSVEWILRTIERSGPRRGRRLDEPMPELPLEQEMWLRDVA
jgi:hypothetical protein